MSNTIPTSFKSKKYPDFIRNNIFMKVYEKPEKVFPNIGLKNCEMKLSSLKMTGTSIYSSFISSLLDELASAATALYKKGLEKKNYKNLQNDIYNITNEIEDRDYDNEYKNFIIMNKKNNYTLVFPQTSYYGCKIQKFSVLKLNKERELIPLLSDLNTHLNAAKITPINTTINTKLTAEDMCSIDANNISICFSSDGQKGYWDIATMSMRGISSCMRWSGEHSRSLIGSILDPYAGIIYLTGNKTTKYGKKMLARSVVRMVVNNKNKPLLLMEPVYPHQYEYDDDISFIFKTFLEQKTGLEVKISDCDSYYDYGGNKLSIPLTEITQSIQDMNGDTGYDDYGYSSYRDSGISYKKIDKFFNPKKVKISKK
jgi:hypothetical protein